MYPKGHWQLGAKPQETNHHGGEKSVLGDLKASRVCYPGERDGEKTGCIGGFPILGKLYVGSGFGVVLCYFRMCN